MSRIVSAIERCRELPPASRCPELPAIMMSLATDGPDLLVTVGQVFEQPDGAAPRILAEQVRCPGGTPHPATFRGVADPGATWCTECRAAFTYAVLATLYASLASLLREDLVLDFTSARPVTAPSTTPPPAA